MNEKEIFKLVKQILKQDIKEDSPDFWYDYIYSIDKNAFIKSAKKYGTPQYLLDEDSLIKRAEEFKKIFRKQIPKSEFYYAAKCNDLPYLLTVLKNKGFKIDVAGIFELQLALKLGFDKIIFTSPGMDRKEIKLAVLNCDKVILNVDSLDELILIYRTASKLDKIVCISLRVSDSVWSKFGFKSLEPALNFIKQQNRLRLVGLHCHSSWNKTSENYVKNIHTLAQLIKKHPELVSLEFIDLGGGFYPEGMGLLSQSLPKGELLQILTQFSDKLKLDLDPHLLIKSNVDPIEKFASEISEALKSIPHDFSVFFEPGRFIVTHSTSIILRVLYVKDDAVVVDGGINLLADYKLDEYSFALILNLSRLSFAMKKTKIYGPLCDPYDIWGYTYFGEEIKKGDYLAVLHQGAYTFSRAWRFIKPISPYTVLSNGELKIAKRREKFQTRYAGCVMS